MLNVLIGAIAPLIDKFIPDKDKANQLAFEVATLASKQAHELAQAQINLNTTEAAHLSIFVSGWRPFTGWVCASALAFNYLILPLLRYVATYYGVGVPPPLDLGTMLPVLMGMLGLGGLRSFEKLKGVARS